MTNCIFHHELAAVPSTTVDVDTIPSLLPTRRRPADFSFKVLVIGDTNVGKTSFINMFCEHVFRVNGTGTIGMDLKKKIIDVDGKKIRLHVWDTAGQERYRTLTTAYYRGATGIIILYDITRETSFNHVTNWLEDIALNVSSDICKVLVGNKSDFPKEDKRLSERATKLGESFNFPYIEASAKTGENVEKVFENLTRQMLDSYNKKMNTNRPLLPRPSAAEKIELLAKKKSTFSTVCSC